MSFLFLYLESTQELKGESHARKISAAKKKCGGEIKGWKLEFLPFPSHDDYRERRGGAERIPPPLRSCTLLLAVRLSCPVQSESAADDQILCRAKQSTCTRPESGAIKFLSLFLTTAYSTISTFLTIKGHEFAGGALLSTRATPPCRTFFFQSVLTKPAPPTFFFFQGGGEM